MEGSFMHAVQAINAESRKRQRSGHSKPNAPKPAMEASDFISLDVTSSGESGNPCGSGQEFQLAEDRYGTKVSAAAAADGGGAPSEEECGGVEEKTRKRKRSRSGKQQQPSGDVSVDEAEPGLNGGELGSIEGADEKRASRRVTGPVEDKAKIVNTIEIEDSEEEDDKDLATQKAQSVRGSAKLNGCQSPAVQTSFLGKTPALGSELISIKLPRAPVRNISNGMGPSPKLAAEGGLVPLDASTGPQEKLGSEVSAKRKDGLALLREKSRRQKRREKLLNNRLAKQAEQEESQGGVPLSHGGAGTHSDGQLLVEETGNRDNSDSESDSDGDNNSTGLQINLEADRVDEMELASADEEIRSPGQGEIDVAAEVENEGDLMSPSSVGGGRSPLPDTRVIKTEEVSEEMSSVLTGTETSADFEEAGTDRQTILQQLRYFTAFPPPSFEREESRPFFQKAPKMSASMFRVDTARIMAMAAAQHLPQNLRKCTVCMLAGHSGAACSMLKCEHCGDWNEHFSQACPRLTPIASHLMPEYKWRSIPSGAQSRWHTARTNIPIYCYNCAGSDHFGDDCPLLAPLSEPGSFSLVGVRAGGYATEEFLHKFSQKLEGFGSRAAKGRGTFGRPVTISTQAPCFDPFAEYRATAAPPPPPATLPPKPGRPAGSSRRSAPDARDSRQPVADKPYRGRGRSPEREWPEVDRYLARGKEPDRGRRSRSPPPDYRQRHADYRTAPLPLPPATGYRGGASNRYPPIHGNSLPPRPSENSYYAGGRGRGGGGSGGGSGSGGGRSAPSQYAPSLPAAPRNWGQSRS